MHFSPCIKPSPYTPLNFILFNEILYFTDKLSIKLKPTLCLVFSNFNSALIYYTTKVII